MRRTIGVAAVVLAASYASGCIRVYCPCAGDGGFGATAQQRVHSVVVSGSQAPFVVLPDPVRARPGDTVMWTHATADSLTIDLGRAPVSPVSGTVLGGAAFATTVNAGARPGVFKYTITVWTGGSSDTMDPELIIDEEEGEQ